MKNIVQLSFELIFLSYRIDYLVRRLDFLSQDHGSRRFTRHVSSQWPGTDVDL